MTFLNNQQEALSKGLTLKDFNLLEHTKFYKPKPQEAFVFIHQECKEIIRHFEEDSCFHPVGIQGKSDVSQNDQIGSYRVTVHDENFAKYLTNELWKSLSIALTPIIFNDHSPVDWKSDNPDELNYWIPIHVSPVFRYMKYQEGGKHAVHYDATHKVTDNPLIRTMQSGVLYLTTNEVYTRFIDDYQNTISFNKRNHEDWVEDAKEEDVLLKVKSEQGKVLLFPHYLPHDVSENLEGNERIIIRFDIFYQAVGKVNV